MNRCFLCTCWKHTFWNCFYAQPVLLSSCFSAFVYALQVLLLRPILIWLSLTSAAVWPISLPRLLCDLLPQPCFLCDPCSRHLLYDPCSRHLLYDPCSRRLLCDPCPQRLLCDLSIHLLMQSFPCDLSIRQLRLHGFLATLYLLHRVCRFYSFSSHLYRVLTSHFYHCVCKHRHLFRQRDYYSSLWRP